MPHLSALSNASVQPKKAFPRVGKVARQCRMRAKSASGTTLDIPPAERHMGRSLQSPVHNSVTVTFSTHETSAIADLRNRPHLSKLPNFPQPGFVFSIHRTLQCVTHLPDTHCVQTPAAESSGSWRRFGGGRTPSERGFFPLQGLLTPQAAPEPQCGCRGSERGLR